MTEGQIGWLAGIIEGEGTIEWVGKNSVRIAVLMTDKDVIDRLQSTTGVGAVSLAREPSKCANKQQYRWRVGNRNDVEMLIRLVLPWMGQRRRERMEEALERLSNNAGRNIPIVHGTARGARRERFLGMERCDDCRAAESEYHKNRRVAA